MTGAEVPRDSLIKQIQSEIDSGVYGKGDKLPSVRELAATHGLATGTVHRAIAVMKEQGVLYTVDGSGTYVSGERPRPVTMEDRVSALEAKVAGLVQEVHVLKSSGKAQKST